MFIGILPQIVPLLLGVLYSFWLPQIWRNARRGNRKALTWKFVLGMSCARLALPLCKPKTAPREAPFQLLISLLREKMLSVVPITFSSLRRPVGFSHVYLVIQLTER
jgi:hypothetical protein